MSLKDITDKKFDDFFPKEISQHSPVFWCTIDQVKTATQWLKYCKNILDIGSGNGKFCLIGTQLIPASFTGVEIREVLHNHAQRVAKETKSTTHFINEDIKNSDFSTYDGLFFYNAFCEHISTNESIDRQLKNCDATYEFYQDILFKKLSSTAKNTRFVTLNSENLFLPDSFELIATNKKMELWIKTS